MHLRLSAVKFLIEKCYHNCEPCPDKGRFLNENILSALFCFYAVNSGTDFAQEWAIRKKFDFGTIWRNKTINSTLTATMLLHTQRKR